MWKIIVAVSWEPDIRASPEKLGQDGQPVGWRSDIVTLSAAGGNKWGAAKKKFGNRLYFGNITGGFPWY